MLTGLSALSRLLNVTDVLAAVGLRGGPEAVEAAPAAVPPPAPAPAVPVGAPPAEAAVALQGLDLLVQARRTPDPDLAASLERQALDGAASLAERLRAEPGLWPAVIDVLSGIDNLVSVRRFMAVLDPAPAEPLFIAMLQPDRPRHARRVSVTALERLRSPESLAALVEALRSDPDGRVRFDVVKALARRRDAAPSETARLSIDSALRGRVSGDPDPAVAQAARALLDETPPAAAVSPAPAPGDPLKRRPGLR